MILSAEGAENRLGVGVKRSTHEQSASQVEDEGFHDIAAAKSVSVVAHCESILAHQTEFRSGALALVLYFWSLPESDSTWAQPHNRPNFLTASSIDFSFSM